MFSDKELRRAGDSVGINLKELLTNAPELQPKELTKAYKWFDTASKLTQAKPARDLPLDRLIRDATQHIRAFECLSSALTTDPLPVNRYTAAVVDIRTSREKTVRAIAARNASARTGSRGTWVSARAPGKK